MGDTAFAQDLSAATGTILPDGVRLGMSTAELKKARPKAFEGPSASLPIGGYSETHRTLMEVLNMGSPGHHSFWYLVTREKLVGVLKTRSLVGIDAGFAQSTAQQTYGQLSERLGAARQETLLRKGSAAFVPVRADVWRSQAGTTIYFIATDHEMTLAVVEATDFPLAQVFIRPDPQRFPVEDPSKSSIIDIERPMATPSAAPARDTSPAGSISHTPDAPPRAVAKSMPARLSGDPPAPTLASQQATSRNTSRMLLLFLAGAVVTALVAVLIRWRKA